MAARPKPRETNSVALTTEEKARKRMKKALAQYNDALSLLENAMGETSFSIQVQAAMGLKLEWVNKGKRIGRVPGVCVGDKFRYRTHVRIVGLHDDFLKGIDVMKKCGKSVAISVVESGKYRKKEDRIYMHYREPPKFINYISEGGNPDVSKGKGRAKDQEAKGGNLALMESFPNTPVRLIRYFEFRGETGYVYDGLYTVADFRQAIGKDGKIVFQFLMSRLPDQPTYQW